MQYKKEIELIYTADPIMQFADALLIKKHLRRFNYILTHDSFQEKLCDMQSPFVTCNLKGEGEGGIFNLYLF